MKLFSEQDSEARSLRRRVRLFLLAAALLGIVTLITVAARHGVFTQTIPIHFFAESAQEITKGMAVKVIGFKIGKVDQLVIEPDNRIKVRILVNDDYARLIPRDSVAKVTKEGLIGASVIEIQPGQDKTRVVAADDVLRFERDSGLGEIAKKLTDQVMPILHDVKQITASINDPGGDVKLAVHNISEATAALRTSSQELQKLLHQGNQKVEVLSGQVSGVLEKTDQNMALVKKNLATVDSALPGLLQKADGTLENVRRISQEGADKVPGLLHDGRAAAGDARDIVSGAKKAWPIRGFVDQPESGPTPVDSYVPSPAKLR
jgi:phospholipid/cholesterol/gamma-HCH transport system substrate-binding protein